MTAILKRYGLILLFCLLGIWIQGSLLRVFQSTAFFGTQGLVANIPLIIVIFLAFHEVSVFGAILAFSLGLELDLFSGVRIGPWAGTLVMVYGFIACFAQRIYVESGFAAMFAVFFASLLASCIYLIYVFEITGLGGLLVSRILGEALFSALIAPLVFRLLRRFIYKRELGSGRMAR